MSQVCCVEQLIRCGLEAAASPLHYNISLQSGLHELLSDSLKPDPDYIRSRTSTDLAAQYKTTVKEPEPVPQVDFTTRE